MNEKLKSIGDINNLLSEYNKTFEACRTFVSILEQKKSLTIDDEWDELVTKFSESKDSFDNILSFIANFQRDFSEKEKWEHFTPQYISLVFSELKNHINLVTNLLSSIQNINVLLMPDPKKGTDKVNLSRGLQDIVNQSTALISNITQTFINLNIFDHFRDIASNIVIVGANGSGKSTFSRHTKAVLGNNVVIIPAQKIFHYQRIQNIPINGNAINIVQNYHAHPKLGANDLGTLNNDLMQVINALLEDHLKKAAAYYANNVDKKESILNKVIHVWNEIFTDRKLEYNDGNISCIRAPSVEPYDFSVLSDGEKAGFYYISHVLLAKPNSYIIIDEPENHLNISVVSKLWDTLEDERKDCRFIYLTHNVDFVSSRIYAKKLWCKKFEPPNQWEIEELPINEELSENLMVELLGSRRKILFCEGDNKSSKDYKLYTILFPDFSVIPVDGHQNVINYTRAFNRQSAIYKNTAIGIIDGDFHSDEEIGAWAKDSIFCLDVHEVENLLCDELILNKASQHFMVGDADKANDAVKKIKKAILNKLEKDINKQIIEYIVKTANGILRGNLLHEKHKDLKSLQTSVNELSSILTIEKWAEERKQLINSVIQNEDYPGTLKILSFKRLFEKFMPIIETDIDRIFQLLKSDPELVKSLKAKYFKHVIATETTYD
jgi:energy-coupling factor transporter ATP-binding protein EcfA2